MKFKDINKDNIEDYIDFLVKTAEDITEGGFYILTGPNGSGKSLIRKLIGNYAKTKGDKYANVSMEIRTNSNPEFGAMSGALHDLEWCATSDSTLNLLHSMLKSIKDSKNKYHVVFDEPEIGCSEEIQLYIADIISEKYKNIKTKVVVSHSRVLIKELMSNNKVKFINLDGLTYDEFINRIPVKANFEEFENKNDLLFSSIRDRINKNKEKTNE